MKYLYLDVDGCVNAFSDRPPRKNTGWRGVWGSERITDQPVLWSHELVERLNKLSDRDDIEIVWLTDWRSEATEFLAPVLGLNGQNWTVLSASDDEIDVPHPWWKLAKLMDHYRAVQPEKAVWVDDNIKYISRDDLVDIKWYHRNLVLINPNSHHGITQRDMTMIENIFTDEVDEPKDLVV